MQGRAGKGNWRMSGGGRAGQWGLKGMGHAKAGEDGEILVPPIIPLVCFAVRRSDAGPTALWDCSLCSKASSCSWQPSAW